MCDGRSLASPLSRLLAGRGAFFRGFPFRWVLHFVLSLTRSVIVHDSASCSREDSLHEVCARAILYLAFSFLICGFDATNPYWVQETQSAKDTDMTCSKMASDQSHHFLTGRAHDL